MTIRLAHRDYAGSTDAAIVIPDDVARELRRWKRATWTEIYGVAAGYSAKATGRIAKHLDAICDFAAAHELMSYPGRGGTVKAFVIGESGLNAFRTLRNEPGYDPDILHGPDGLMVATPYCLQRTEISG
jgi:hypothetical protein